MAKIAPHACVKFLCGKSEFFSITHIFYLSILKLNLHQILKPRGDHITFLCAIGSP